jgi:hypothetical protein
MAKFQQENYSVWSAKDVILLPDQNQIPTSAWDFFAVLFMIAAFLALLAAIATLLANQVIGAIAVACISMAFGILAVFFAAMSGRRVKASAFRVSHRDVFEA